MAFKTRLIFDKMKFELDTQLTGKYHVTLPYSRTQIVKYNTVDGYSGNTLEVVYEGTPCY